MNTFTTVLMIAGAVYTVLSGIGALLPAGKTKTVMEGLALDIKKVLSIFGR
jgi:hypothetical protein